MFSHGGAIYYTVTRGAFWIYGDIYKKWMDTGGELGELGYPISDEEFAPDEVCRFNRFSCGGAIYSTPEVSKHNSLILYILISIPFSNFNLLCLSYGFDSFYLYH